MNTHLIKFALISSAFSFATAGVAHAADFKNIQDAADAVIIHHFVKHPPKEPFTLTNTAEDLSTGYHRQKLTALEPEREKRVLAGIGQSAKFYKKFQTLHLREKNKQVQFSDVLLSDKNESFVTNFSVSRFGLESSTTLNTSLCEDGNTSYGYKIELNDKGFLITGTYTSAQ